MATILIVDDRSSNRQFLTTLLGYGGHRLLEAVNGAEALELARAERPDLVITDILMPTMDGFEFTQRLRSDPALEATPVIFHTATYSEREAEKLAKSCGVRSVVPKPCDPLQMLEAVSRELGAAMPVPASPAPAVPNLHFDGLHTAKQHLARVVAGSAAARAGIRQSGKRLQQNVAGLQRIASRLSALIEVVMEMTQERDPARLVKLFFGAACDMIESKYAALGILDDDERKLRYVLTRNLDPAIYANITGVGSGLFDPLLSPRRVQRTQGADAKLGGKGFPEGHPSVRSVLAVAIATRDKVYGWLYFADRPDADEFSEEDERLAAILAAQLALLYEHAQLYDVIQRHAAALQIETVERRLAERKLLEYAEQLRGLPRRLVTVEETTRRNVNRELHDRVGQNLAALNINLNLIRAQLPRAALGAVSARLQDTQKLLEETAGHIRNVMAEMHPPALDEYGLLAALRSYAAGFGERLGVPIGVQGQDLAPRLELTAEMALFRIAQGALANAVAHAQARQIRVTLATTPERATLSIADDGIGFDPARASPGRASWGLAIMRERAEAVGATLAVESAPGRGTRIVIEIPREAA